MYIDALLDRKTDKIHIAERIDGQRIERVVSVPYVFYCEDPQGTHRSIFGHRCKRQATPSAYKFHSMLRDQRDDNRRIFESDINPVFRALADRYIGAVAPVLHLGFFDIEVAFDLQRSFAPPHDPFSPITAISLYRSADQKLLSFLLKPPTLAWNPAQTIAATFDNCILFDDEKAMLMAFLDAIEDVDCLTGWSSSQYDIPYLVNRIQRLINIQTSKRLCLWDQAPSPREYINKFGRKVNTYDLVGRVHLDYLDLYAKHNPQQRLSYALNSIGEIEVGETKVPYDGTLDDLYKRDFDKFIRYNRQDVMLMVKIDDKLKFIDLANQIAHSNCVLLKTTMGSVALVEQAIINEVHAMGLIVPDRPDRNADETGPDDAAADENDEDFEPIDETHTPVVGAYVAQPKTGLQDDVGCVDLKSLYPSAIRSLNMSPETLIGQVRLDETMKLIKERVAKLTKVQRAEAWDGLFCTCEVQHMLDRDASSLTVDFFDHLNDTVTTQPMTGRELHDYIFNDANQVCISANGTIFSTATEGIIPALLSKWYSDREAMQRKQKTYEASGDAVLASFWDRNQLAGKIRLNATYGALLNTACRFYDQRLGQSTTLTGRSIDRHMNGKINEIITGRYDHRGDAIVYADTDSCYFTVSGWKSDKRYHDFDWSKENVIALYDLIAEEVNLTFPTFMQTTFHTSLQRGSIIQAGRELVASRGLFIKKKKYAVLMIDKEGKRLDGDGKPGKLKVMGLDLKRADTPKVMQQFLETLLMNLLTGVSQAQMFEDIKMFRQTFKARPGWEKGSPKKVANLAAFTDKLDTANQRGLLLDKARRDETMRVTMPGHVRASLNWNRLCEVHDDHYTTRITDSNRIIVCKLRSNTMGMTSIAYPIDEPHLPEWFRELPFDDEAMEETIIDQKITNLCGVLNWDLTDTRARAGASFFTWT